MSEIDTLQTTLPTALCKPLPQIPVIKPEEVPERKLEYTKESLLAFKEELRAKEEAERQAAATGADGGFFGGFGGDGGDGGEGSEAGEAVERTNDETEEESVLSSSVHGSVSSVEQEALTPLQAILRREEQVLTTTLYTVQWFCTIVCDYTTMVYYTTHLYVWYTIVHTCIHVWYTILHTCIHVWYTIVHTCIHEWYTIVHTCIHEWYTIVHTCMYVWYRLDQYTRETVCWLK